MNNQLLEELKEILNEDAILLNEPLRLHTTYKIGGPADYFLKPSTEEEIAKVIKIANKYNIEYFLLGKGSNLIITDKGYRGIIIYLGSSYSECTFDGEIVNAKAGASLIQLSNRAYREGLSGFEYACGIPGTVGGAVYMNAGAYGSETKDILIDATVIDEDGNILKLTNEELKMEYRKTILSEKHYIVTSARFKLSKKNPEEIKARMEELNQKRRSTQPIDMPNAGSVFKRPEGEFPGKLIDDAGLKGYIIGGAMVSEKHANFIVNIGGATAKDVFNLIDYIREKVYENSKIDLVPEVRIIGER